LELLFKKQERRELNYSQRNFGNINLHGNKEEKMDITLFELVSNFGGWVLLSVLIVSGIIWILGGAR
jgi:hypothetical protein